MYEELTKAEHTAELLAQDIRAAYSTSCKENTVVSLIIYDLISKVAEIESAIKRLNHALGKADKE